MSVTDTSSAVYYNEVEPKIGQKQQRVLDALTKATRAVNNQEVADFLDQPINTVTPRMNELVKLGKVRIAFKDIYPKTNRRVIYWEINE